MVSQKYITLTKAQEHNTQVKNTSKRLKANIQAIEGKYLSFIGWKWKRR
jgi:hypothetical protein